MRFYSVVLGCVMACAGVVMVLSATPVGQAFAELGLPPAPVPASDDHYCDTISGGKDCKEIACKDEVGTRPIEDDPETVEIEAGMVGYKSYSCDGHDWETCLQQDDIKCATLGTKTICQTCTYYEDPGCDGVVVSSSEEKKNRCKSIIEP